MARRGQLAYTDGLAKEVLALISAGLTLEDAAIAAGISEDTLTRWRQGKSGAPADFADRFTRATPRRSARWLGRLWELCQAGDTRACESLLDRCSTYRKTQQIDLGNKDGAPFVVVIGQRQDGPQ